MITVAFIEDLNQEIFQEQLYTLRIVKHKGYINYVNNARRADGGSPSGPSTREAAAAEKIVAL